MRIELIDFRATTERVYHFTTDTNHFFLNIFLSTKKNKQPPTKFAIIVEYVVSIVFNDIKQNANNGVDNCHLSKYNKYSFIYKIPVN